MLVVVQQAKLLVWAWGGVCARVCDSRVLVWGYGVFRGGFI